ncbi:MAG: monovalent cation/H+ antiporter subunit D [Gammaproteobacteria bacterium]|nr:monovalent cation/H+ antiporter subunit D [Gammaproteobacteria bacterium]
MQHLAILPILIPLVTGAILLLLERRQSTSVLRVGAWVGMAALLAASVLLLLSAAGGGISVYLLGDWPARLGITLVVDRLSALMVLTTTLLAIPCLLHATAGWDKRALHFHTLFQLQLAGLNGSFLTGDLFNLFVFFEVMLVASFGLLLSGGLGPRIAAGMHYVVFNIVASTLFLIALGLLYGMLGTLNMAEMAVRVAETAPEDVAMVKAAAGLLLVVFCGKAALLPLYIWLPEAYSRAPAAVAALFTIMTKVGVYAVLRVYTLLFGAEAGPLADFAWSGLLVAGALTLVLAAIGVVGATRLRVAVAYLVMLSAGTIFIAVALANADAISGGLYYLAHSVFVTAALFLIADLVQRQRGSMGDHLLPIAPPTRSASGILYAIAAVSVAGLPPFSGFIGKFVVLGAVPATATGWIWAAVLGGSLLVIIGLSRTGTRLFWRVEAPGDAKPPPSPRPIEVGATVLLLAYGVAMTVAAGPILRYTDATAEQLLSPDNYVRQVQGTQPQIREPSP